MQAWALDTVIPYDGVEGNCSKTLVRLFRGLWGRSMGSHYNQQAQDPNDVWEVVNKKEKTAREDVFGQMFSFGTPPPSTDKPEESNDETKE
jgi:hypothetical protein